MKRISQQPPSASSAPSRITLWLGDERRFWLLTTILLGLLAILKGIRKPGTWADTQAQLDYTHGFLKRGLLGEFLTLLHIHKYRQLTFTFLFGLAIFYLALVLLTRRSSIEARFSSLAVAALFASSYVVTFLAHIIGYTDILNATLTIAVLLIRNVHYRFLTALAIVPIALLIHENFLLLIFPVLLFSFFIDFVRTAHTRILVYIAVLIVLAIGITLRTSLHANRSATQVAQLQADMNARSNFPMNERFMQTLTLSLGQNIRLEAQVIRTRLWQRECLTGIANVLPLVLALFYFSKRIIDSSRTPMRRWLYLAAVIAIASPMLMHILGWDAVRWCVASGLDAFLVLCVLSNQLPRTQCLLTAAERNAIILLIAINMASGFGLMDDLNITPYPFFPAAIHAQPSAAGNLLP